MQVGGLACFNSPVTSSGSLTGENSERRLTSYSSPTQLAYIKVRLHLCLLWKIWSRGCSTGTEHGNGKNRPLALPLWWTGWWVLLKKSDSVNSPHIHTYWCVVQGKLRWEWLDLTFLFSVDTETSTHAPAALMGCLWHVQFATVFSISPSCALLMVNSKQIN